MMPDGGFDVSGLLTQAAQGSVGKSLPAPDTYAGANGIPTMVVRGGDSANTSQPGTAAPAFDVGSILGQAAKGQLKYTPPQEEHPVPLGKMTGWSPNIGAGIKSGVIGAISAMTDPVASIFAAPKDQGPGQPLVPATPVGDFLRSVGGSPDEVVPGTPGQATARALAEGAGSMLTMAPGAAGGTVPRVLASLGKTALAGGVGAVAGQTASDAAPDWAKPAAGFVGNLAGNIATEGVAQGARALAEPAVAAAGRMGVGPKQDFGGVQATESQLDATGQKIGNALGDQGRDVLERATTAENESRDLEAKIADPAVSANDKQAAQDRLGQIQSDRVNLVPGSEPTTAQVVQTPGATDLDQALRVADRAPFLARAADQNNARVGAVQSVQPTGEPQSVGKFFTQQLDALDQAGQEASGAAREGVQATTDALGGQGTPSAHGQDIRDALATQNAGAKAHEKSLWNAIDPDGTLALPISGVQEAARGLLDEVNPNLGDRVPEQDILSGAASLPQVIPFRDAQRLRSNIGTTERALRSTPGNDQSLRRLGIVKSALDADIASAAETAAHADPAVADRLSALMNQGAGDLQTRQSVDSVGGSQPVEGSVGSANGTVGGGGNGSAGVGGSGIGESDRPVAVGPADALTPNFGPEDAARYASARQATLERKQTFGQGAVGRTLAPGPQGAEFRADVAEVPRLFLSGNAVEPGRVQKYIEAVGGESQAVEAMRGALIGDLRDKGIIQQDGTVDPKRFDTWRQRRAETINQFPGLSDGLETAASAQQTFDKATSDHAAAVKQFQNGVAGDFLKDDPLVAVRKAFGSGNATQTFSDLAQMVRGNPDAEAGLKRAVVDYIGQKMSTTAPSGGDVDFLNSSTFRKFIQQNKEPLRALFGGQGTQTFEMVAADLRRAAQRSSASEGSQTSANEAAKERTGIGKVIAHGAPLTVLTLIGEHLGEHFGHGMLGAVALPVLGNMVSALRQSGISTINDLTREAMLHPALAHALMQRVGAKQALSALAQRKIAAALQGAVLSDIAQSSKGTSQ